jgi:thioester reductase-like protein
MTDPRADNSAGSLLLTGATGFLGMELLARYLERTNRHVYALVRAADADAANERLRSTLRTLLGTSGIHRRRVTALAGDIEIEGLGLEGEPRERLAERVSDIVHTAASISFSLPLGESRQINVDGTRRLLEFAELCRDRGGLRRFSYVSTAYVAGTHSGEFREDQLEVGQDFRNAYERSKFEAERLVRSYSDRVPIQIFRPSIIVGERPTGWTAAFNVLYAPLKAFSRGAYPALPARRSAPVDVVPVDYVADAAFELTNRPGDENGEETYHLVAGRRATTVGHLVDLSARYFGRKPPRLIPPAIYRRVIHPLAVRLSSSKSRDALKKSEVYFPYFSMRVRYDDRRARSRLESAGIYVTPVDRYFDRLASFATRTRWGKAAVTRAEAWRGVARPSPLPADDSAADQDLA